jgi:hypothetical protein
MFYSMMKEGFFSNNYEKNFLRHLLRSNKPERVSEQHISMHHSTLGAVNLAYKCTSVASITTGKHVPSYCPIIRESSKNSTFSSVFFSRH